MIFKDFIIKERKEETRDIVVVKLVPKEGQVFDFRPGQYVMVGIYSEDGELWEKRALSLASSPLNKEYIELGFKIHGEFTKKAFGLKEGDVLALSDPTGFFTFSEKRMENSLMLAGGIGITPLIGMIRYATDKNLPNKITLLYSNKTEGDIAYYKELKELSDTNQNFKVIFTVTDEIPDGWQGEKGRVDKEMLKKYTEDFSGTHFLLCGPTGFMEATIKNLKELGASDESIEIERF